MAHKNPITLWVLSQKDLIKPVYNCYDWPARYFPGLLDFSLQIEYDGIQLMGRGFDQSKEIAVEKASAEAIEWWLAKKLGIPAEGLAVSGELNSDLHAKFECLERYYLKQHLSHNEPLMSIIINDTHQALPFSAKILAEQFHVNNSNSKIDFFQMATPAPYHGLICRLIDPNCNVFFGFSLSTDPFRAIQKSFYEALPNFALARDRQNDSPGLKPKNLPWHLQPDFVAKMSALMIEGSVSHEKLFTEPILIREEIDLSGIKILQNCPIKPIKWSIEGSVGHNL